MKQEWSCQPNRFVYLYFMLYLDPFDECKPASSILSNTPFAPFRKLMVPNCIMKAHAENFIGRLKVISLEFMANALEDISICQCAQARQLSLQ